MQVVEIGDIGQFDEVKAAYEAVYSVDPYAQVFISWTWLRGWLEMIPGFWVVLCVRENEASPYTAFLPLMMQGPRVLGVGLLRFLHMGRPEYCYGGFLCSPGSQDEALTILADHVGNHMHWDLFSMNFVRDPRLNTFISGFSPSQYDVNIQDGMVSLCADLPGSWDSYLQDCLSIKTRRNLLRHIRALEQDGNIRITQTTTYTLNKDINALFGLWQARWGKHQMRLDLDREMHRYCFDRGILWLAVIWHGDTPIAALSGIVDRTRKTFLAYYTGYNREYSNLGPGRVIFGYAIRWAIENGYQAFDFTGGQDAYKSALGAQDYDTKNVTITRRCLRTVVAIAIWGEPNILKRSMVAARRLIAARKRLRKMLKRLRGETL